MQSKLTTTMDGNSAAAYVAYAFTEVAAIYPITPSSVMADQMDKFSCGNKKNIFGSSVQVAQMQSEAGAAGAIHGALSAGALATTFTSSQGLLLMIPNMYKIAGELLPNVIHVAARSIATHALSIFGDHSDIYACRQTGYAMLCSNSPQEVAHMAAIAHLSSIKSSIPFLHFFDGFRTSHEIQKINLPSYEDLKQLVDWKAVEKFKSRGLNPSHPVMRGTAQNDDVFFQNRETTNKNYLEAVNIVGNYMEQINKRYHTNYKPFEYYGAPDAKKIIIAMGSVCETIEETVDYLMDKGEKVGVLKVRLYRPFSAKHLLNSIPEGVEKISVLDRTKECGSSGEPLYLDVLNAVKDFKTHTLKVFSGRYGLASKNTTPDQIMAVFENMDSTSPKKIFTVGINDDVTHLSLSVSSNINTIPQGTYSCKFWGVGSDGTVGASKNTIKIIGDNTDLYVQGFFSYDSKKSGGTTISHLRFGNKPIKSTYYVQKADFLACHASSYVYKYDLLKDLKPGGKFLLNCSWSDSELEKQLPANMKRILSQKNIKFYILDAAEISRTLGLGGRVNTALQAAFFKITNIFEPEKALNLIKEYITKSYSKKGIETVNINFKCAEEGMKRVREFVVPKSWENVKDDVNDDNLNQNIQNKELKNYVKNIVNPVNKLNGNDLPVSAFLPYADGSVPLGSSACEKRNISAFVPSWKPENCIECNLCSYVCPHAVIRPSVMNQQETTDAPTSMKYKKMNGAKHLNFSVSISVRDCTGCGNCVEICPGMKGKKALEMKELSSEIVAQTAFDYSQSLDTKPEILDKFKKSTVKGSQFRKPLLEFSGACAGCGETPYAKLATQLFGTQMIIANATGCSSIWAASFPSTAYTTVNGKGPAWHNSLFEDNAEFGFGIALAQKYLRNPLIDKIKEIESSTTDNTLKDYCKKYILSFENSCENQIDSENLVNYLTSNPITDISSETKNYIIKNKDNLSKKSVWIFGGDGWAYDIGYGGLDHVLASQMDVNILVFDTEVYSNTGGQASKATPAGAVAQFAAIGKSTPKKDLAAMAMNYPGAYVAQVSLGANFSQCLKAFIEAENHKGPSIIIAYAPCINHGIKGGMKNSLLAAKMAVSSGYWPLFRYNPSSAKDGESPMKFDSPNISTDLQEFTNIQSRYTILKNSMPERFNNLIEISKAKLKSKQKILKEFESEK